MAQGLKVGDAVSLIKAMRVSSDDPGYAQGLRRLKKGQAGQVVAIGLGHSVAVEFDGKRITLPSRRLDRLPSSGEAPVPAIAERSKRHEKASTPRTDSVSPGAGVATDRAAVLAPENPDVPIRSAEQPAEDEQNNRRMGIPALSPAPSAQTPDPNLYTAINYNDPRFITAVANTLLVSGNNSETLLIQLRVRDLPDETRTQVEALIQAKLALGPEPIATPTVEEQKPKRRGPKRSKLQP